MALSPPFSSLLQHLPGQDLGLDSDLHQAAAKLRLMDAQSLVLSYHLYIPGRNLKLVKKCAREFSKHLERDLQGLESSCRSEAGTTSGSVSSPTMVIDPQSSWQRAASLGVIIARILHR